MFESFRPFRKSAVPNWEYLRLKEGGSWKGFMAGPVIGVPTHFESGTTGCRKALTGGALKCPCQVKEMETRWRGYVPLWDADGVRWVVIIGERFGEVAMRLKHMDQVRVIKTTGRGHPLRVEECGWTVNPPPLSRAEKLPQDLRRWMARVWDDPELEQWFYEHRNDQADPTKPIPYTVPDEQVTERVEEIKSRIVFRPNSKDIDLPGTAADAIKAVLNGKHKKKK